MKANEITIGMILNIDNNLCRVVKKEHVKPGKGGAYFPRELKDIVNGTKFNIRFRSDESVVRAILDEKPCQFSYIDGNNYVFMGQETFEQIELPKDSIPEEQLVFLAEQMIVSISFYDEKVISLTLPQSVILEVVDTQAVIKGQTASSSYKPATLSNGVSVDVPPHIGIGDKIVVKIEDCSYVERAK